MLNWNLWHTWEHYENVVVYLHNEGPGAAFKRQDTDDADEINVGGHIWCGSADLVPVGTAVSGTG